MRRLQADEQQQYQNMLAQQQFAQQQQAQQEQYVQQQQYQQYMQQQAQMQPAIAPQATGFGSNNPFAAFSAPPAASPPPPLPTSNSFSNFQSTPAPVAAAPAPSPQAQRPPRDDGKHAHLANLLAGGREDGLDTFGNIGNMRVPVYVALMICDDWPELTQDLATQRSSVRSADRRQCSADGPATEPVHPAAAAAT